LNLQVLDLSQTAVAFFPDNFCNLTRLEFLDLTANDLGQFGNLHLSSNAIQCFSNLTSLQVLNGSYSQRSYFLDKMEIRVQDIPNLEIFDVSNTAQYIDGHPWVTARLMKLSALKTLDFSGTTWQDINVSFSLPQNWTQDICNQSLYEDVDECFSFATSWSQAPLNLKLIDLSGLYYCLGYECDDNSKKRPFLPGNYSQLVDFAKFGDGGFNCTTTDNYQTFRCER
jgi:Leucine-rich repeat (LRR) protein